MIDALPWVRMSGPELDAKTKGSGFVFDVEAYPDLFFIGFRCLDSAKTYTFEISPESQLDRHTLAKVLTGFELIGFNSRAFDLPLITLALNSPKIGALELSQTCQSLIANGWKWFEVHEKLGVKPLNGLRHIDLCEVVPLNASYGSSLKMRAAQMGMRVLQELPFPPTEPLGSAQKAALVRSYCCGADLEYTAALFHELREQIDLRRTLSNEYQVDLLSKSDAQIAEAVIRAELTRETNGRQPSKSASLVGTTIRYDAPSWVRFSSPKLRDHLERIINHSFRIVEKEKSEGIEAPEWLSSQFEIGANVYATGIGGLHSQEKSVSYKATDGRLIVDRDVASYYPAIIINQGLYPAHLGPAFSRVYTGIRDRRLEAKKAKQKAIANSLKIVVNGGFGKLNSRYSLLYSPKAFLQVVLTGQLAVLMLVERFEQIGIPVISANTDGFVSRPTEAQYPQLLATVEAWERFTGFETEETRYSAYYARDVNNYVAVKEDGKVKGKGAYSNPWTGADDATDKFKKNPDAIICVEAAQAFLAHRTPLETTIRACQDPSRFAVVRRVAGGGQKNGNHIGKVCRWYYSTDSPGPIVYQSSGNAVGDSEGACPMMHLPDALPPDLDFRRYIAIAQTLVNDTGYAFVRQSRLW